MITLWSPAGEAAKEILGVMLILTLPYTMPSSSSSHAIFTHLSSDCSLPQVLLLVAREDTPQMPRGG